MPGLLALFLTLGPSLALYIGYLYAAAALDEAAR